MCKQSFAACLSWRVLPDFHGIEHFTVLITRQTPNIVIQMARRVSVLIFNPDVIADTFPVRCANVSSTESYPHNFLARKVEVEHDLDF